MKMNFTHSLLLLLLMSLTTTLAQSNGGSVALELWCVAKNNAQDADLQSALDWACGSGGANCGPIQQGGPCYDPTDIQRTASYAFNDYYLKNGMSDDACNFDSTAALTSLDPSYSNCKFPSSKTGRNGNSTVGIGIGPTGGSASADISRGNCCVDGRWRVLGLVLMIVHIFLIPFTMLL